MAAVHITSPIVRHAPLLESAKITELDLRGETCWFVLTIVPLSADNLSNPGTSTRSYKIFRRFEHFQYFANYIKVECKDSNCQVPKLKIRKRLLFSKNLYAERRKEDLNRFLLKIFQLPLKVKSSLCFAEFLGIWKGDLKENRLDSVSLAPKLDYLDEESSSEVKKIVVTTSRKSTAATDKEALIPSHCPPIRSDSLKQTTSNLNQEPRPYLKQRKESTEDIVCAEPNVQRAKTCLTKSLSSHNMMSSPWNNLEKTPSLKVAPWNIRHLTPKEMFTLEDKRQSLTRSHTYTLGIRRSMHFISPFIRIKVLLNSEHIITFLVPRNVQLDEMRRRISEKIKKSGIDEFVQEDGIIPCYKYDNKLVIVATNEDLRRVLVDNRDKFVFYLPSNNLLEEFFWMREVMENRHSIRDSKKPNEKKKFSQLEALELRQAALLSFQKRNTLVNFRKSESLSVLQAIPNIGPNAVKPNHHSAGIPRSRYQNRQYRRSREHNQL
ncbi:hypothetical protein K7432_008289 [Basidiobolus ranarum]|uniref:PX domain-containing protein n=1 Tax=Basidiobolus ranarum TaxID=34480 RepID=A0ABR2VYT6_9FUNG